MNVQVLYDLREKYGFDSGDSLSDFFEEQGLNSAPSGYEEVSAAQSWMYVNDCCAKIEWNSSVDMTECRNELRKIVKQAI